MNCLNEILEIAASLILRKIKVDLHDETDTYYAILAELFLKTYIKKSLWQYVSDTYKKAS